VNADAVAAAVAAVRRAKDAVFLVGILIALVVVVAFTTFDIV